jgi:hypothetical protein
MSKKSGPLNSVEKFYIDNNQDKNVKELAGDLNRNQKIIREYSGDRKTSTTEAKGEKESTIAGELFGHKEGRGVTVMTPAASEVADSYKSTARRLPDGSCIHRIKD